MDVAEEGPQRAPEAVRRGRLLLLTIGPVPSFGGHEKPRQRLVGDVRDLAGVPLGAEPARQQENVPPILTDRVDGPTIRLQLEQVPLQPENAANTMTAPRYPKGIGAGDLLPKITAAGSILAGGLHPEIKAEYFRIGHMGPTTLNDLLATVGAIEVGLSGCGYEFQMGDGVSAAIRAYQD